MAFSSSGGSDLSGYALVADRITLFYQRYPTGRIRTKLHDGRDRTKAEVVDRYDPKNTQEGRQKEQAQIDKRGLENLDNKRNEIRKPKNPDTSHE